MSSAPSRSRLLALAAVGCALLAAAPTPWAAVTSLRGAVPAADPTAPLVAASALLAWALAAWLSATVAITAAGSLPGAVGTVSTAVARRVAPVAVRRAVEVALGLTAVTAALSSGAASAAPVPPLVVAAVGAPSQDRPAGTALDWPTTGRAAADRWSGPLASADRSTEQAVIVGPGDSLWRVAAERLQAADGSAPSSAQISSAWPRWWAANREAVGEDPDLIRPGLLLVPPDD